MRPINNVKVDSYCRETNNVYQFQGCYFHECKKCFPQQTVPIKKRGSYNERDLITIRQENTAAKSAKTLSLGNQFVVIQECKLKKDK